MIRYSVWKNTITYTRRLLTSVFALILLIHVLNPAISDAQNLQPRKNAIAPPSKFAQLKSTRFEGQLPVIIQLDVDAALSENNLNKAAVQEQRSRISNLQNQILTKLNSANISAVKSFANLPLLALHSDVESLRQLALDPQVVAIFPDELSAPTLAGSTPLIGATTLWNSVPAIEGNGQVVAVLDTGVDKTHPFLAGKVVDEACFSTTEATQGSVSVCPNGNNEQLGNGAGVNCAGNVSGCSHGTHVAGIAAGLGNTFSGVARGADIMAIQVFSRFNSQNICGSSPAPCVLSFTSDQLKALDHVLTQSGIFNIASVNMSLGGGQFTAACDTSPLKPAIDLLRNAGIATIIASGNNGFTNAIGAPACISSAVSVGSTTKADQVSGFSNSHPILDLLAPGSSIQSSVPGGGFQSFNGTSMATPHVAGAFALLRSAQPAATVDSILNALKSTGVSITDTRNGLSKPRIQVDQARTALGSNLSSLIVAPDTGLTASGAAGGPFNPGSMNYILSNTGLTSIDFQVTADQPWLTLSPATGSIGAGANTTVNVSIDADANNLAIGSYSATVSFTNTTNGVGNTTRPVLLTVTGTSIPNDKFIDAIEFSQSSGTTTGSNNGASKTTGEPDHAGNSGGASVWWRWTVQEAGEARIDSRGSNFDTLLGVYTGSNVAALTEIASNDDIDPGVITQSEVVFQTQPGETYFIAVDGFNGAVGDITLNWTFEPDQVTPGNLSVSPDEGFISSGFQGGPFAPNSKEYVLTNTGSNDVSFTLQGLPDWLDASQTSGTVTPSADVTVTLTVNNNANNLVVGKHSAQLLFNTIVRNVEINVQSSTTLLNDDFVDAIVLNGNNVSTTGFNLGATMEQGEIIHAYRFGGASVWWVWTAPGSGIFTVDISGSNFDTLLGVYQGSSVDFITNRLMTNDDQPTSLQSEGAFQAVSGQTYFIAVDGFFGASGGISLNISPGANSPDNDDFANAEVLTAASATITGSNALASAQNGEPFHASFQGGHSLWWRFTPAKSGEIQFDTFGSDFDTMLAVYAITAPNTLSEVASNDDANNNELQSAVVFNAQSGVTYFIAVDGFIGSVGNLVLNYQNLDTIFDDNFE